MADTSRLRFKCDLCPVISYNQIQGSDFVLTGTSRAVPAWALSGYSGFLPHSKNMGARLIGDSKLPAGVNCECGRLFFSIYARPVMN